MTPNRPSIRQVAARAGVSPKTVTNVMRERAIVAPETKARVLEAVRELHYVPVRSAVQNRHVETKVLSVLFDYDSTAWYGANAATFNGLSLAARERGYDLLVHLRRGPEWADDTSQVHLLDRRSDGVILAGLREHREALSVLVENNIPTVSCFEIDVPANVAWVVADNDQAMRLAVEHLAAHGHTRIAHLCGPPYHAETEQRRQGFERAIHAAGLGHEALCVVETDWEAQPEPETLHLLLRQGITGAVCFNDSQALTLWQVAQAEGLNVPRDLSLVGMDNEMRGEMRGLTSIVNPFEFIARTAVEALLAVIRRAPASEWRRTLPVELIERTSVTAPRHGRVGGRIKGVRSM